jgi:hypothetical protein
MAERRHPVGDQYGGFSLSVYQQLVKDAPFGFRVYGGESIVQDEYGGVPYQRPAGGYPLLLAA